MAYHTGMWSSTALLMTMAAPLTGPAEALQELTQGVREVATTGIPGPVVAFGPQAFSVVRARRDQNTLAPVVVATDSRGTRIVLWGHNGYFSRQVLAQRDTGVLMANSARWASRGGRIGVVAAPETADWLRQAGLQAAPIQLADSWDGLGALVLPVQNLSAAEERKVAQFLRQGGGLVSGGPAWGYLQLNPSVRIDEHPINRLTVPYGVAFADGMLETTIPGGFSVSAEPQPELHAEFALTSLSRPDMTQEQRVQAAATVIDTMRSLPATGVPFLDRLEATLRALPAAVPRPDAPVRDSDPLARLAVTWDMLRLARTPPSRVEAHPSAHYFPGAVADDAPRVTETHTIDTRRPRWHSTGLYAVAGEPLTVTIPASAVGRGLSLRIGCHTDTIWHLNEWRRMPEITKSVRLDQARTVVGSAFGGLVYVDVPRGASLGTVEVQIAGAVKAPRYVHGRTSRQAWRRIREYPAPWAELETNNIIVTVPSSEIRDLDDPISLMNLWDEGMDAIAWLAAVPKERESPERFVTDIQISAGWMHAGYPIMAFNRAAPSLLDPRTFLRERVYDSWGPWHEVGHNHQSDLWTFDGTGEVTCNLFTLYAIEQIAGLTFRDAPHPALNQQEARERRRQFFARGAPFDEWRRDPFLALGMYYLVVDEFGWNAIRDSFAAYQTMPEAQRPRTDDQKRDVWMVTLSRTIGRNLGPYFQVWGVPTSEQARAGIANLPPWMPAEFAGMDQAMRTPPTEEDFRGLLAGVGLFASATNTTMSTLPKHYICARAERPPIIDGRLDPEEWGRAQWTDFFEDIEGDIRPRPRFRTRAKMLWDDTHLYIAGELKEPDVWATITEHDAIIFMDNNFEVFIDPNSDNHMYYELQVNAFNTHWDLLLNVPYKDGGQAVNNWEMHGLRTAVDIQGTLNNPADTDQGWTVEIAIPWTAIIEHQDRPGQPPRPRWRPSEGTVWRINFSRVQWDVEVVDGRTQKIPNRPENNWVWSPQGVIDMHRPERWGYLVFTHRNPADVVWEGDYTAPARDVLHRVYYAVREFRREHERFPTLEELALGDLGMPVELHTTPNLFEVRVRLTRPDGTVETWCISYNSRVWRE